MSKITDIYSAINNLPDELITDQIWEAAIEEGNLKILNILPDKFMTEENINKVIQKGEERKSWYGFDLSKIPEIARTQTICDKAVEKDKNNFIHVPDDKKTNKMLCNFLYYAKNHLEYMQYVPEHCWDTVSAKEGVTSLYKSDRNEEEMRMIQILLHYVPAHIKTDDFFISLFQTGMAIKDIEFLTPNKFKNHKYYIAMAKRNITAVPIDKLDYELIMEGIKSDDNCEAYFWDNWKNDYSHIKEKMFSLLDAKMVDLIIRIWPDTLCKLPEKYQTKSRLLKALSSVKKSTDASKVYKSFDISLFDVDICKAIVRRKENVCPKFAESIWTKEFIDFCTTEAPELNWFNSMPIDLQTPELVKQAFEIKGIGVISDIRPDLITYDLATKAYVHRLSGDYWTYEKYVPNHFLEDFVMETGLPKEFFGGETTYSDLKEKHKNYKYFIAGECYIGFFVDKDGRYEYNRVIMTRRTPMQIKPSVVFSRTIGTFHKTWIEKIIADNDPQFSKPVVEKGLKGKQINPYLGIRLVETYKGVKIYGHSLYGDTIIYSGNFRERDTLEEIKAAIDKDMADLENKKEAVTELEVAC